MPERNDLFRALAAMAGTALLAAVAAVAVGSGSVLLRGVLALALVFAIIAAYDRDPLLGLTATLVWMPAIAISRRMLIESAGWETNDPLLLVSPAVVLLLCARLFLIDRRRLAEGVLSALVLALIVLGVIASINPRNGSPAVGLGGMMFMVIPVLWFFVGREYVGQREMTWLFGLVIALACAAAAYGFFQSTVFLPSWDRAWTEIAGYGSLFLERDVPNTFGPFASTAEYTLYMGCGILAALGFALHGRTTALIALPLLLPAIFLSSSRSAFVFALFAMVVVVTLRFVPPRAAPWVIVMLLIGVAVASPAITAALQSGAASTSNARVEYQLSGLGDPLNREQSTVTLHAQLFADGVRSGLTDPVGRGTGVTNNAIRRFGPGGENAAGYANTEVDIANTFVSLGLFGGICFLAILICGLATAVKNYLHARDGATLAALGVLAAMVGHWLSGGHYAVTPLVWIVLGFSAALRLAQVRSASAPAAGN